MALFWRRALWRWRVYRARPRQRKSPWRWWAAVLLALALFGLSRWPHPIAQKAFTTVKEWAHRTGPPFASLPVFPAAAPPADVLDLSLGGLSPPVAGAVVEFFGFSPEGPRPVYRTELVVEGAEAAPVRAAAPGKVEKITLADEGWEVVLRHGSSWRTVYSFLGDVSVREGQAVEKGALLGFLQGTRLHFGLLYRGQPVDPLPYLGEPPDGP
ncbi:MAG: M23 family metallopeptidase [Clostridiales bacterium]|nr:M23 family metallopeptidase [Clostridiales bacterium]